MKEPVKFFEERQTGPKHQTNRHKPTAITALEGTQREVDKWIRTYGVRYFSESINMAVLTEEVGELARVMARKYGGRSFREDERDNLDEEIADILWVLLYIANQTGVDVTKTFRGNLEKKTK